MIDEEKTTFAQRHLTRTTIRVVEDTAAVIVHPLPDYLNHEYREDAVRHLATLADVFSGPWHAHARIEIDMKAQGGYIPCFVVTLRVGGGGFETVVTREIQWWDMQHRPAKAWKVANIKAIPDVFRRVIEAVVFNDATNYLG